MVEVRGQRWELREELKRKEEELTQEKERRADLLCKLREMAAREAVTRQNE